MTNHRKTQARFKVGDWVSFPLGAMHVVARILEDTGPIGHLGRRLYRIEIPVEDGEPDRFVMPEESMAPAAAPKKTAKAS